MADSEYDEEVRRMMQDLGPRRAQHIRLEGESVPVGRRDDAVPRLARRVDDPNSHEHREASQQRDQLSAWTTFSSSTEDDATAGLLGSGQLHRLFCQSTQHIRGPRSNDTRLNPQNRVRSSLQPSSTQFSPPGTSNDARGHIGSPSPFVHTRRARIVSSPTTATNTASSAVASVTRPQSQSQSQPNYRALPRPVTQPAAPVPLCNDLIDISDTPSSDTPASSGMEDLFGLIYDFDHSRGSPSDHTLPDSTTTKDTAPQSALQAISGSSSSHRRTGTESSFTTAFSRMSLSDVSATPAHVQRDGGATSSNVMAPPIRLADQPKHASNSSGAVNLETQTRFQSQSHESISKPARQPKPKQGLADSYWAQFGEPSSESGKIARAQCSLASGNQQSTLASLNMGSSSVSASSHVGSQQPSNRPQTMESTLRNCTNRSTNPAIKAMQEEVLRRFTQSMERHSKDKRS